MSIKRKKGAVPEAEPVSGERKTFFVRAMMVRLPARAEVPEVPQPAGGLASNFLRVAAEADRPDRANAPAKRRQYPAGAMPDKSPIKRRKRVRF